MIDHKIKCPDSVYSKNLVTIGGIHFTPREIDILCCLLNERSTNKIAEVLSIFPKTVGSHIQNVMLKLECNSRDNIIDFIEKSGKISLLRKHYVNILILLKFKKSLREMSKLRQKFPFACKIVYWKDEGPKDLFVSSLESDLKLVGLNVSTETRARHQSLGELIQEAQGKRFIIYIIPRELLQKSQISSHQEKLGSSQFCSKKNPMNCLFLISGREGLNKIFQELFTHNFVNLGEQKNYFFLFFEILKKLFPNIYLNKVFEKFKQEHENLQLSQETGNSPHFPKNREIEEKKKKFYKINRFLKDKKWLLLFSLTLVCICYGYFLLLKGNKQEAISIRSDLIIPTQAVFLNRPELITQLNTAFNKPRSNHAIALIGPGGAGKTTLSRQYAHLQKANVIWEINAETHESLKSSFENLAQALARTEKEQKILKEVRDIKDLAEREEKLIQFVKESLRTYPNWFLIFDNIEKFTDIQKYFPQDATAWGEGKIILTTRDKNIINNKYITDIIYISELSSDQKLKLFTKIMNQGSREKVTSTSMEKVKAFLDHIPPFPLDISVASYYLKATNVPYATYLENLTKHNEDFEKVQCSLLKEAGGYTKTRYNIITLSLALLLNAHTDFAELLLLICLLDSQNIPRDLLNKYKTDAVVDNFIHHLNKYSLLTNKSTILSSLGATISIHRSTQIIALFYLKKILDLEKNKHIFYSIDTLFENYIDNLIETDDPSKMKSLISHCNSFLSHNNLLNDSMNGLMLGKLGIIHYYNGHDNKAKELLEESLLTLDTSDKSYFAQTATFLAYLGNAYKDLGQYDKAKNFLEKSLATYNRHLSEDHPSSVWVLIYLGNIYRKLGDYRRAKNILEKSLFILKDNHSEEPMIAWAWQTLGVVFRCTGDYEQAKHILENVLVTFKKYNPDHIDIAWILENLGIVYGELGDHEGARDMIKKGLEIYKKHFSDDYTYVASCLSRLGMVYIKLKEYKNAKSILEKSLVIFEREFGKNHVETARIIEGLGLVYLAENNLETANEYFQKALLSFEMNNHPDIYMIFEDLADLNLKKSLVAENGKNKQQSQDLKDQAIFYLKQAIEVIKTHFPKDSPHIIRIQSRIKKLE